MYNETQLAAIRVFGDKTLSFGCLLESKVSAPNCKIVSDFPGKGGYSIFYDYGMTVLGLIKYDEIGRNYEILGHEPHLHDLLRVAEKEGYKTELTIDGRILFFRLDQSDYVTLEESVDINKNIPLLSQPNLSEIVNLFSN